jgi:Protein of unknown function (DUF992)
VRPPGVGICVTTTIGGMAVAGSARNADLIQSRLDTAAETCLPTAVRPANAGSHLSGEQASGLDGRGAAPVSRKAWGALGSYNFMSSKQRHAGEIAPVVKSRRTGNCGRCIQSLRQGLQPHLGRGSNGRVSMEGQMWRLFRSSVLFAFVVIAAVPALAQTQRVRVGSLTCVVGPRAGLVLGSRRELQCVFRSNLTGRQYAYTGKIRRIGLDVGITRGGRLSWAVFATTTDVGRNSLKGSYVGVSGNVAVGVGLGAKVLIGGSRRTVSLQPLSVEGQIGINLALGITNLSLQ